jgi:flagellar basal-body rod protein FlgG
MTGLSIASTAMNSLKQKVEVIANNIANSNTSGYKRLSLNFGDLMYQYKVRPSDGSPNGVGVGKGVKVTETVTEHAKQGSLRLTGNQNDIAINGKGFLRFQDQLNGRFYYTRNGALKVDDQGRFVNSRGDLLDPPITTTVEQEMSHISEDGRVWVKQAGTSLLTQLTQMQLFDFPNPSGLQALGNSSYEETSASGAPVQGQPKVGAFGSVVSGALEASNVQIVKEMMDLIVTQRAFDTNQKVIFTEDKGVSPSDLVR